MKKEGEEGGKGNLRSAQRFFPYSLFRKTWNRLEKKPFFPRVSSESLVSQVERDEETI